jgi:hypothetical protein
MLGLSLQFIGFMFVGLMVIIGAVAVGLPYLIAKAAGHDQATCDCWDCQNRRTRAIQKAKARGGVPAPPSDLRDPKDFWSTSQLRTSYHVLVKGTVYRVTSIRTLPNGDTKVGLQNVLTQVHTMIIITRRMHEARIWRKGSAMDGL